MKGKVKLVNILSKAKDKKLDLIGVNLVGLTEEAVPLIVKPYLGFDTDGVVSYVTTHLMPNEAQKKQLDESYEAVKPYGKIKPIVKNENNKGEYDVSISFDTGECIFKSYIINKVKFQQVFIIDTMGDYLVSVSALFKEHISDSQFLLSDMLGSKLSVRDTKKLLDTLSLGSMSGLIIKSVGLYANDYSLALDSLNGVAVITSNNKNKSKDCYAFTTGGSMLLFKKDAIIDSYVKKNKDLTYTLTVDMNMHTLCSFALENLSFL